MGQDSRQVAHCARGDEQPGLLTNHLGPSLLQAVDRGVLPINIVADLGACHGSAHFGRGAGNCVGSQVDDIHEVPNLFIH